jgi:hypothetical protein
LSKKVEELGHPSNKFLLTNSFKPKKGEKKTIYSTLTSFSKLSRRKSLIEPCTLFIPLSVCSDFSEQNVFYSNPWAISFSAFEMESEMQQSHVNFKLCLKKLTYKVSVRNLG